MTFQIFDDLDAIITAIPEGDIDRAWKHFYSVQSDLEFDKNASKSEKDDLQFVNENMADALRNKTSVLVRQRLSSLRISIERRTTGLDGYKIRE